MIHIVTHANRLYYQAQILAMHQHRSRLAQGARAHLSGDDARGCDEFDDDEAVYLMALGPSGDIQSTVRIRPTVGRGMMSERHPELTYPQEGPMRGVETWEISRFFVAPSQDPTTQNPGVWRTSDLILAAMEHASRAGATRIVGLNAVPNFDRQRAANINIRMIGPVQEDGDLSYVAVEMAISPEDIEAFRRSMGRIGWAGYEPDEEDFAAHDGLAAIEAAFDSAAMTPIIEPGPEDLAIAEAERGFRTFG